MYNTIRRFYWFQYDQKVSYFYYKRYEFQWREVIILNKLIILLNRLYFGNVSNYIIFQQSLLSEKMKSF